jgi:hypothetical protein
MTPLNSKSASDMWVISRGRISDIDISSIVGKPVNGLVMEYDISDFSHYMLNPNPVCIKNRLVGFRVDFVKPFSSRIKEKIKKKLPLTWRNILKEDTSGRKMFVSGKKPGGTKLKDRNLEMYCNKINEHLMPYDTIIRQLSKLDTSIITDIKGVCEDLAGNRLFLNISGDVNDQISYIKSFLYKDVSVTLKRAYLSNGLFEMRGYDFRLFDAAMTYKMLKVCIDGKTRCCVFNSNNQIEYWVENIQLFYFMHMLEHSLLKDSKFNNALDMCIRGDALPLKIFFNKQFLINYSEENLPGIYKDIFQAFQMESYAKTAVVDSLKHLQYSIAFNCISNTDSGPGEMVTSVSVMHNFRALEPIKKIFPHVYSSINKKAYVSEAGKYYLLDSLLGYGKHA